MVPGLAAVPAVVTTVVTTLPTVEVVVPAVVAAVDRVGGLAEGSAAVVALGACRVYSAQSGVGHCLYLRTLGRVSSMGDTKKEGHR